MGIRINSNVVAQGIARRLGQTNDALGRSYSRLASGLRIATAADDPAGLGIAGRMRSEIRSLAVARRNVQDGVSLVQVAEGALSEFTDILHRSRELAMQAANGTLSRDDRLVIEMERQQLAEETRRIIEATEFNGLELFDRGGDLVTSGIAIQVGTEPGETVDLRVLDVSRVSEVLEALRFHTPERARGSLAILDVGLRVLSRARGQLGAFQVRLESAGRSIANQAESASASLSRIADLDYASETAEFTRLQILQQSSVLILAQANAQPHTALELLRAAGLPR